MPSKPPSDDDDPAYRRTCTRCYVERNWTERSCPRCSSPEFMLPEAARRELAGIQAAAASTADLKSVRDDST